MLSLLSVLDWLLLLLLLLLLALLLELVPLPRRLHVPVVLALAATEEEAHLGGVASIVMPVIWHFRQLDSLRDEGEVSRMVPRGEDRG